MTLSPAHQELLTPKGMVAARSRLASSHSWFIHVANWEYVDQILDEGLQPRNPEESIGGSPRGNDDIIKLAGESSMYVVCMKPIFTTNSRPNRGQEQFLLAVSNSDLPDRLGVDWSFSDVCMSDIDRYVGIGADASGAFLFTARDRGSFVSYDSIPTKSLRVWKFDRPQIDPSKWPVLSRVKKASIAKVSPSDLVTI